MSNILDVIPLVAGFDALAGLNGTAAAAFGNKFCPLALTYDGLYNSDPSVDTAKGTWMSSADAEWSAASHLCRYAESLNGGTPGAVAATNYYDPSSLLARIANAVALSANAAPILQGHATAINDLWTPPYGTYVELGGYLGTLRGEPKSVRTLEVQLFPLIAQATAILAAAAYT